MNESIIISIFLLAIIVVFLSIIVSAFTQFGEIDRQKKIQHSMRQLRRPVQPWVTVLLYAHNHEASVIPSLKSLLKNQYHNFDIVVIDDRSSDSTTARVKTFSNMEPETPVSLLKRRIIGPVHEALRAGYKKSRHGALVISMTADTVVSPLFIKQAVAMRGTSEQWKIDIKTAHPMETILDIASSLWSLLFMQSKTAIVGTASNLLRTDTTCLVLHKQLWRQFIVSLLITVILVSGFILNNFSILWYSWLVFTLYLLSRIWLDDYSELIAKVRLTFSLPVAFFMLPATSLVIDLSQLITRK